MIEEKKTSGHQNKWGVRLDVKESEGNLRQELGSENEFEMVVFLF